jgi:imidazolonepropionase-like amidohydrolase
VIAKLRATREMEALDNDKGRSASKSLTMRPGRGDYSAQGALMRLCSLSLGVCLFLQLAHANPGERSPGVAPFIAVDAPLLALTHVRVVDGSGSPAREDQTVLIAQGRVQSVGDATRAQVPRGARVLELPGRTVLPGLVGMHDHLFCTTLRDAASPKIVLNEIARSAPRLYLAGGVTTIRTTGSLEPYADLNLKRQIDGGQMVGPRIFVTGPYLEGAEGPFLQMPSLRGPADARRLVEYWADQGVTSFKAYMHITRAELKAAIEAAHERHLQVTGHLCSIGYREAAALGIDNLEHGFMVDTELTPGKKEDVCPSDNSKGLLSLDVDGAPVQAMLRDLVEHHVAITSTLPVFEAGLPGRSLDARALDVMVPEAANAVLRTKMKLAETPRPEAVERFKHGMALERAFVRAGGTLVAGSDPTGIGAVLPGFADQRELELLVEAGFTPLEAIRIATANGAELLGERDRLGTIAPGKLADLIVVHGDPSTRIKDIEQVEMVFKDGVGYDPKKLIESVRGIVGLQ